MPVYPVDKPVHMPSQSVRIARTPVSAGFPSPAGDDLDLSRFSAAPSARLSHLAFESDRAFPTQC
jgi:hypothetical protein